MAFNGFIIIINILFFGLRQVQLQDFSNPCSINRGGCDQKCESLSSKVICSCYFGKLQPDGKTCKKDSCVQKNCSHDCYELLDSVMCSCPPGMDLQPNGLICLNSDTGLFQRNGVLKPIGIICGIIFSICLIINYLRKKKLERTSAEESREMQRPGTDVVVPHTFDTQNSDVGQPAPNRHDYLKEDLGVINMANTNNSSPPYDLEDLHRPLSYESTQCLNSLNVISSNDPPPMYSE
ncbi:uncharacterized protein LOC100211250 isoform X1 [Hydra vulgaris]|uniref:uncharacterized protein LOC100211250 isoform X1 n=1 Tax=Hydra vulgaris TaxID=6087 RepID=UPI001F5F2E5D|nr:uncharacterized protein LOC100211250 isoform X2 [Hydra vulgaris]